MNRYSSVRDRTDKVPSGGGGMDCRPMWLCGHKHSAGKKRVTGRGLAPLMWKCADCAKESK